MCWPPGFLLLSHFEEGKQSYWWIKEICANHFENTLKEKSTKQYP